MELEIHRAEKCAALYVDGKLDRVGDVHLANERALELLGVYLVPDDAFMRGQAQLDRVAETLEEVQEYADYRARCLAEAEELERQAAELSARAKELKK
jgi:hypothetical protein